MAKIHGISNCTRFLLNGLKPINGKKLVTFEEIVFFNENYSTILSDTKKSVTKEQDELITSLNNRESLVDNEIKEDIARRRNELDAQIIDLRNKIYNNGSFLLKIRYLVDYSVAKIRSYRGIYPTAEAVRELEKIRTCKIKTIQQKNLAIKNAEKEVEEARWFLTFNTSFFIGAQGEEQVIKCLSALPDGFHILNDVFFNDGSLKKDPYSNETYQIDHIVIGPTGIFLIETKNWKTLDSEQKIQKISQQMRRSSSALRKYLKVKYGDVIPWIQSIVISVHGNQSGLRVSQHIDIVTPDQLSEYIMNRKKSLPSVKIEKLIELIPYR